MCLLELEIISAVRHAEKKHPEFAENRFQAVSIIGEEFGELAQAVNDNDFEQAEAEALDLIATCIRFLKNKNKLKE